MTAPAVATTGLTKRFGSITAVDGLDLRIESGEVFGYLGPNGAGKTTTIRLLLDLLRPDAGSIEVLGGDPADPDVRRRVGYLPADLRVSPRHRGDDVLAAAAATRGTRDEPYERALADRFDLDLTRPVADLSTGNRRKVGIVATFGHRPDLLVLDEPTAGLDPLLQHEFQALVREAAGAGATVLLSSHVLPEVEDLADRVAILRRGRLVTVGAIEALRGAASQHLRVHLAGDPTSSPADAAVTFLQAVPGVRAARPFGARIVAVEVDGPLPPVLAALSTLDVARLEAPEADLESTFLSYYGSGEVDG